MSLTSNMFYLMAFFIIMNTGIDIVVHAVVDSNTANLNEPIFTNSPSGLSYSRNLTDNIVSTDLTINSVSQIEDSSDSFFQILDKIGLGFFRTLKDLIYRYLFGFVTLMNSVFGQWLQPSLRALLFGSPDSAFPGLFVTLLSTFYTLAVILLFSNKKAEILS